MSAIQHAPPAGDLKTLVIACGLPGLFLALLWWIWPLPYDPLSQGLGRTFLFNRLWVSSPVRPVLVDIVPDMQPPESYAVVLERLVSESPSVIALPGFAPGMEAGFRGLTVAETNARTPAVLLPGDAGGRLGWLLPAGKPADGYIGLRFHGGTRPFKLRLHEEMTAVRPGRRISNTEWPAAPRPAPLYLSSFAYAIVSEHAALDGQRPDAPPAPVDGRDDIPQRRTFDRDGHHVLSGGHGRFYDIFPAKAIIDGRLPRGGLRDRIILMGAGSGGDRSGGSISTHNRLPAEITALMVWALLNEQVAHHPRWALWIELLLIMLLALTPAYSFKHFATPAAWGVTAIISVALVLLSALIWHLSGAMIQVGAGLLALTLSTSLAMLFARLPPTRSNAAQRAATATIASLPNDVPEGQAQVEGGGHSRSRPAVQTNPAIHRKSAAVSAGAPADMPAAHAIDKIGRYEILRCIGKGAMGEVLLGRDPNINRLTAIKTVHFEDNFARDEIQEIKEKFFREAESAGTLSHANIVTIYDAGEDRDLAYIAMEYLEGTTLLRFTRAKRLLPVRKIIAYTAQIAEALDYAHARGIVHRDIKPANIIVLKCGAIKITDFGIARIAASSHTQTGVVKGTPYYMSPEQFSGGKVDGRSDVFSLGTMLFQLLTGTLPFFSESPAVLMNQIMNFPHPNPQAINPRVIPAIIPIVDRALEKNREQRYPDAGRMARDLNRLDQRIQSYLERKTAPLESD